MQKYVVLITNKNDVFDRYFVIRDTAEEARSIAKEYTKDNYVEIVSYHSDDTEIVF